MNKISLVPDHYILCYLNTLQLNLFGNGFVAFAGNVINTMFEHRPPYPYLEALIPNVTIIFGDKVAVCKLGREYSLGTDSASPTILDISASIIVRNKFLLFKATQLVAFCYGSLSRLGQATCICIISQECSFKAFQTVHSHSRKNIIFKVVPKYSLSQLKRQRRYSELVVVSVP